MDFSSLLLRTVAAVMMLGLTLLAAVLAIAWFGAYYVAAGLLAAVLLQTFWLVDRLTARQREWSRFLEAIRFGDYAQTFSSGKTSRRLAEAFNSALAHFRDAAAARDSDANVLRMLFEQAPTPLLTATDGRIDLMNAAARRIPGHQLQQILVVAAAGKALAQLEDGGRTLRYVISSSEMTRKHTTSRILSAQNIEGELGTAEFDAWRDLVRVLTHEIMNSLTPVASLSQLIREQARGMSVAAIVDKTALADLVESADALAVRARSLLYFVESYRTLTRLPPPNLQAISVATLLSGLQALFEGEPESGRIQLAFLHDTAMTSLPGDASQLEQALLNLIANAREASFATGSAQPVEVKAERGPRQTLVLSVADRGAGIPPDLEDRIFTPFFTTKANGAGIGLSLVRQIALAHKGWVSHAAREGGGTIFFLHLPDVQTVSISSDG